MQNNGDRDRNTKSSELLYIHGNRLIGALSPGRNYVEYECSLPSARLFMVQLKQVVGPNRT